MMKMSANNMNEPIVRWRQRGVAVRGIPCQLLSPSIATNASDHVVMVKFIICYHTTFIMLSYDFFSCCHLTFFHVRY